MKKSVLQSDIKKIDEQLKNQQLPAEVRKALASAKEEAQKILEAGIFDAEKSGAAKAPAKKNPSGKAVSPLEDCEEILARYRKKNEKEAVRAKKRERAGKPPELTVAETIGKAAKSVAKKVKKKKEEDKPLTDDEVVAAVDQVIALVRKLAPGMGTEMEKRRFFRLLINNLTYEVNDIKPKKAEKGMHLKGAQMQIFHYHTLHFDISPKAHEYFRHILNQEPITEKNKSVVIAMARDVDELLGKVKGTAFTDAFDKIEFIQATGYVMRAMYWNYAIAQALSAGNEHPNAWYPGFLAHDLYVIANHTKKETDPKIMEKGGLTGRHPGIEYAEGDEVVESLTDDQLRTVNDSLSNDENTSDSEMARMWAGMGIPKAKGKHIISKYRDKFRTNPFFELEKERTVDITPKMKEYEESRLKEHLSGYAYGNKSLAEKKRYRGHIKAILEIGGNSYPDDPEVQARRRASRRFLELTEEDVKGAKKEKGGAVKFRDKVHAIEKKLEGKPVPKKYQQTEGKKFTKKTATAAARRIAGSMEKNTKKKTKKMLLGGVALHTPLNISSLGDLNNLDIH